MIGAEAGLMSLLGGFIGFILTLCIFSYAFGDNILFRLALYLFVGVSTGFVAATVFTSIIWPQLLRPIAFGSTDERLLVLVPLFLSLLLFSKAFPRFASIGSPVMAFLVGVGAATILGGATLGTLFPQVQATLNAFDPQLVAGSSGDWSVILFNNVLILLGLLLTLASFQFGTRAIKNPTLSAFWKPVFTIGRIVIAITFGVIYAGVIMASLSALVERFKFLINIILSTIMPA